MTSLTVLNFKSVTSLELSPLPVGDSRNKIGVASDQYLKHAIRFEKSELFSLSKGPCFLVGES